MCDNSEMYCIRCHGRGIDRYDRTCRRCKGTGYEPETHEAGRGAAGCQYAPFARPGGPSHSFGLLPFNQVEGSTPSPGTIND